MKKAFLVLLVMNLMVACSKNGGNTPSSGDNNPPPPPAEKSFEGKMQKFNVDFVNGGSLQGGPYLAYRFEINSNVINKGDLNIYDCQNSNCSIKTLIYKMNCYFNLLTCAVTDGQGKSVKKGDEYKADAADVGEIQTAGNCRQFTGGAFQSCFYITLVDPKLKMSGYYDQHFAAEFIPKVGPTTELNIFHLKYRP
jgi:hypothetical protein